MTHEEQRAAVHFIGFRDDRYWNAAAIFGRPDFIHRIWDRRAQREISASDILVFAVGCEDDQPSMRNGNDIDEEL